jgi:hypothetical protein
MRKRAKLTKSFRHSKRMHKVTQTREARAGLSTPTRCSKMTIRTTRQLAELCGHACPGAGTGQENDTSALPYAIRTKNRDPKRHRVEGRTSWESHKTHTPPHQHQTQTKPTDPYLVGQHVKYRALQHGDRVIDDATQMLGIIDKHYRDLGKPSGEKHGTYTPSGSPGDYPWEKGEKTTNWRHEPVSSDSDPGFTTQSWISQRTTRVAALSNGRARTRRHSQRNH